MRQKWLPVLLALATCLTFTPGADAAESAPTVTRHGVLSGPASAVVLGADGAIWHITAGGGGRVGRTTLEGTTTEWRLDDDDDDVVPVDLAAGWDGRVWVVDSKGHVRFVTPLGGVRQVARLDDDQTPTAIAIGWDGLPWVAVSGEKNRKSAEIARVSTTGEINPYETGSREGATDLAPGPDGALWFTEAANPGRIARIDVLGHVHDVATGLPGNRGPTGIAAGPGGTMWFTERFGAIGRIDPTGAVTEFRDGLPEDAQPGAIAASLDGTMYFALADDGIGRITQGGAISVFATPGARPVSVAPGLDGAIWFADSLQATLGRLSIPAPPGSPGPPAPPGSPGPSTPPPFALGELKLGETVLVAPVRGTVRVKPPGAKRFRVLGSAATVPVRSLIDTRAGTVLLVSATDDAGGTQTARFHSGLFKVRQRADAMTLLALRGKLECARASWNRATTSRRRKRRRLWGSDLGGAFSTLGRDSVTTVRGTRWLTEDRCGGTLTRVTRGSVVVRDRHTGRRIVVRAGERYFARRS
jgi:streptogramin lyase